MCPFDVFVNEKSIGGHSLQKREKPARPGKALGRQKKRGHLPWQRVCVYCSNFSNLLTFLLRGLRAWFTSIDWGDTASPIMSQKEANFIMSGYKYFCRFSSRRLPPLTSSPAPVFYVCLYWTHKSNGKTWIWIGKMLREIYVWGEIQAHGHFMTRNTRGRGENEIKSARLPHRLRQSIYLEFHLALVINFFIVEGWRFNLKLRPVGVWIKRPKCPPSTGIPSLIVVIVFERTLSCFLLWTPRIWQSKHFPSRRFNFSDEN